MSAGILNLGEAVLQLKVERAGLTQEMQQAKQEVAAFQDTFARRVSTSPFQQYINDIRILSSALEDGRIQADQYALGLERSFQRMHRAIGGPREAAEALASSAAPRTPLTPAERRDYRVAENRRLYEMGQRGDEGGLSHAEYVARRTQIMAQYREEMANLPAALQAAAAAEDAFSRRMQFAEPIIERSKSALQQYLEQIQRLRDARSQGDITAAEFGSEAARAKATFQQSDPAYLERVQQQTAAATAAQYRLNHARQIATNLDQRGTQVTLQFANAQERHNARMIEYEHLLQRGRISQETFNRAQRESIDIMKMDAASARGGMGGRVGNMLMMQGSYALQDFATVLSMKGMGIGDALRASSNNIGMMAMMIGGPSGSLVAALATLGSVAPGLWEKYAAGADDAKDKIAAAVKDIQDEFRKLNEDFSADSAYRARKLRNSRMEETPEMYAELERLRVERDEAREERKAKGPALAQLEADVAKYESEEAAVRAGEKGENLSGFSKEEYEAMKEARDRLREDIARTRRDEERAGFESRRIEAAMPGAEERELQRMRAKSMEEEAGARRRFREEIFTTEANDEEIRRQRQARDRAQDRRDTLKNEMDIETSRPDGGRKDVIARLEQQFEEQHRQEQVASRNIDFLKFRQGGLLNTREFDEMQRQEMEYLDRQKRRFRDINPRLAAAQEAQDEFESDIANIKRNRPAGADRDAEIESSRQALVARLQKIRGEDRDGRRGSFGFSDPTSMFRNIQSQILNTDPMTKAQKDTTEQIKQTNLKLDSLITKIEAMNPGLL